MNAEAMPVSIRGRFRRSVNLARDFYGDHGMEGYIVTVKGRQLLGRIAEALESGQAQRAWSIFGPYGGGKSAFALFASYLMRGSKKGTPPPEGSRSDTRPSVFQVPKGELLPGADRGEPGAADPRAAPGII